MTVAVRWHKNGWWQYDITGEYPDGAPYRERRRSPVSTEGATRKWAEQREKHLQRAWSPIPPPPKAPTLKAFGELYLAEKEADGEEVKPSYLQYMRYTINGHLVRNLGELRLSDITKGKIDELRRALKAPTATKRVRSDKCVNDVLALLAMMLRSAAKRGLISSAPEIVMLKRERRAKKRRPPIKADGSNCYTDAQFRTLVAAARLVSREAHIFALLGGDHGLRRGEIMALRWSDFDDGAGVVRVNRAVWVHKGTVHEGVPKGGAGRELPITAALRDALPKSRRTRGARVLPGCATYAEVRKLMRYIQAAAGFAETGKAHALRHTFCSRLAMRGVPVRTIQALAGHANIETTERYLHTDASQERAAMAMLGETPAAAPAVSGNVVETTTTANPTSRF